MRIGVIGVTGRMGQELAKEILSSTALRLTYALVRKGNPWSGRDISALGWGQAAGLTIGEDSTEMWDKVDGIIDFTHPATTLELTKAAAKRGKACIIGTSGFTPPQVEMLRAYAQDTPIVYSNNMSLGVNILTGLVKQVAAMLGEDFDVEILEMHHRHKKDAPSGTALMLGQAAAEGRKVALNTKAVYARQGLTGERAPGEIGFATLRGGDVIGDHNVIFAGDSERIELSHKASTRSVFAKGAVRAALWSHHKKPGLYSMQDVLFGSAGHLV